MNHSHHNPKRHNGFRMKKLLQINQCLNFSTGKITQQIGELAIANGWESWIAYSGRMPEFPSKSKLIRVGNFLISCLHYVEDRLLDNEGLASRWETRKLIKKMEEIKPDVVQLHILHDHWLNYRILFRYLAQKHLPVVWTQHDQWATTGHCFYSPVGCERWKDECHDCPLSKWYCLDRSRRNFRLKKQLMAEIPSLTIVAVSEWLANMMKQSHLKHRKIEVIHNGVDIQTFSPQPPIADDEKYGIDWNKKILLGVASLWDERKGLHDYIELSKRLDDRFVIVLVGLTDEQIKKLPTNIIGIKRTQNQTELAQLYSMADILLSLSYAETFGMTMAEAFACGTPCVVYDNTAQPDIVSPGTGFIAQTGGIDNLVRLIYEMTENSYKQHHTADCRKRAEEHFDKDKCFEKYIELYESLIERDE